MKGRRGPAGGGAGATTGLPEGWRPTWRAPKERRPAANPSPDVRPMLASATTPPIPEIRRQRAIAVLLDIMEDEDAQPAVRVGAARAILEASAASAGNPLFGAVIEPPAAAGGTHAPPALAAGATADTGWK